MSKKSCPILLSKSLYKNGQDIMDIQNYIVQEVFLNLQDDQCATLSVGTRRQTNTTTRTSSTGTGCCCLLVDLKRSAYFGWKAYLPPVVAVYHVTIVASGQALLKRF